MAQDCQTAGPRGKQACLTKSCGYYSADPSAGRTLGGTRMYTAILTRTCSPIRKGATGNPFFRHRKFLNLKE